MNKKIFIVGIIFLILDQVSKIIIESLIKLNDTVRVIDNFFSLTNVQNTGAAFSILEGRTMFLTLLSIFVLILLLKMSKEFKITKKNTWAFGLLIGGIFGNFSDRLFLGYVRDFLEFNIFGYSFPVFNIADACIVIGVILLIISILQGEDKSGSSSTNRRKEKTR